MGAQGGEGEGGKVRQDEVRKDGKVWVLGLDLAVFFEKLGTSFRFPNVGMGLPIDLDNRSRANCRTCIRARRYSAAWFP